MASSTGGLDELTDAANLALEAGTLVEAQAGNLADDGDALSDDAQALADDLDASAAGIGSFGSETRTKLSALAADPIAVDATRVNAVGGSAGGLAPFLMALAAWLGVMGIFLVLPAIWAADSRRWVRGVLVAFGIAALVGTAGALLMVAGMRLLLDLQVADLVGLLAFAVLATLAFTAIIQALVALFGSRGWLVALLLLVVQVAALGIPYAVSTVPGPIAIAPPVPADELRGGRHAWRDRGRRLRAGDGRVRADGVPRDRPADHAGGRRRRGDPARAGRARTWPPRSDHAGIHRRRSRPPEGRTDAPVTVPSAGRHARRASPRRA